MLNQTYIGMFRTILKQVCDKSYKHYVMVDERNTTKECSVCGTLEHKDPSVRVFTCPKCGTTFNRDCNSSINIAKKQNLILSGSDYLMKDFTVVKYNITLTKKYFNYVKVLGL
jgi:putative transposase